MRGNDPADADVTTKLRAKDHKALQSVRTNLGYVLDPNRQGTARPARFRTRALLKTVRYIAIFVFWRLVRSIRYAIVGSIIAAVAGTAVGSMVTGIGFFIAPPGILAGAGVGLLWGLGKFGWRTLARRARDGNAEHADPKLDEEVDAGKARQPPPEPKLGTNVEPW